MAQGQDRRSSANPVLGVVVVGLCAVVIALCARFGPHVLNWDVFALSLAGIGTLALAGVTFNLVSETTKEREETHRLAQLAARDQEARIRPAVMLWHDIAWFQQVGQRQSNLPFVNAGDGPALNVNVQVYWKPGNCALATTSLAPGEKTRLYAQTRIDDLNAWGRATYSDLLGRRWETRFVIAAAGGQLQFQLRAYGLADLLPQHAYPLGWEVDSEGLPRVCLPNDGD